MDLANDFYKWKNHKKPNFYDNYANIKRRLGPKKIYRAFLNTKDFKIMRVVQIIDSLEAGGERMVVNCANALANEIDFSALVVTLKGR
jgi:hypothetical protein